MMSGALAAVALLLALAGAIKLRRPGDLVRSLRMAGFPASTVIVRALALVEVAVGGVALAGGATALAGGVALAAMALYLGFGAFFVTARRRRGPLMSCGCFGRADSPVTTTHVVLDLAAAAVAGASYVTRAPGLLPAVAAHPGQAPALVLAVAGLAGLGYLGFAVAPTVGAVQ